MLTISGVKVIQNLDKTGVKVFKSAETLFQNADKSENEVVNVPTKPLKKTPETSEN